MPAATVNSPRPASTALSASDCVADGGSTFDGVELHPATINTATATAFLIATLPAARDAPLPGRRLRYCRRCVRRYFLPAAVGVEARHRLGQLLAFGPHVLL